MGQNKYQGQKSDTMATFGADKTTIYAKMALVLNKRARKSGIFTSSNWKTFEVYFLVLTLFTTYWPILIPAA